LSPRRSDVHYRIAYSLEALGDDEEAARAYSRHLEYDPSDVEATRRRGACYMRLGKYEEALDSYSTVLEQLPKDADALYASGNIYEYTGDQEKSASAYVDYVETGEKNPEALITASRALVRLGFHKEGLAGFTLADSLLPSGDKRAFHGMNAARGMMGWPTDEGVMIVPGEAVGAVKLGGTSGDVLSAWGRPLERVVEGEHALWGYGEHPGSLDILVYFENGSVIEISTGAETHRTSDGLGIANFLDPKYASRFDRWVDTNNAPPVHRYILREGGLAFYSGKTPAAVVFSGEFPLSEPAGFEWEPMAGGNS
jgi:tetratricopeptide (TPR) repeat protein